MVCARDHVIALTRENWVFKSKICIRFFPTSISPEIDCICMPCDPDTQNSHRELVIGGDDRCMHMNSCKNETSIWDHLKILNVIQVPRQNEILHLSILFQFCIYTLRPRSAANGSTNRSPTADTEALLSSNCFAAYEYVRNLSINLRKKVNIPL